VIRRYHQSCDCAVTLFRAPIRVLESHKQGLIELFMAEIHDADQMLTQSGGGGEVDFNMDMGNGAGTGSTPSAKKKSRSSRDAAASKRRCVSTACIACRKRKSKCDGNMPSCAACSSVYRTGECLVGGWFGLGVQMLTSYLGRVCIRSQ
jgi:hypothetical protein